MLEIMILGGKSNSNYLPDSGPGNKSLLAGSVTDGWFGLIDSQDMPNLQQINADRAFDPGAAIGGLTVPPRWLKAVLNGKYIFTPNGPWSVPVNYATLYGAGYVFGLDEAGPGGQKPSNIAAVNQLRYMEWVDRAGKPWLFKIRLFKGNVPIAVSAVGNVTVDTVKMSEHYTLFSHVVAGSDAILGNKWDNLVVGTDISTFSAHDQTFVVNGNSHTSINNGIARVGSWWSQATVNDKFTWMPVLEIVTPEDMFIFPLGVTITKPQSKALAPVITTDNTPIQRPNDLILLGNSVKTVSPIITPSSVPVQTANAVTITNTPVKPLSPIFS